MPTINSRIVELIDNFGIKKIQFAEKLGISTAYASQLCSGVRTPSDRTIADICREFNVRREWLETGEGPMKLPETDPDMEIVNDLLSDTPSPAAEIIRDIYNDLLKLNEAEQDIFLKFLKMRKGKE